MFDVIIRFVLKNRILVSVCYIFLVVFGIYSLSQLPIDVLPDLNKPRVTVFASAEWLGTQEVEEVVTWPLERIFINIPGVEAVRSSSAQELSVINVEFAWGSKNNLNRQQIFERLQNISLPAWVHTSVAPETALLGEVVWVGLTAKNADINQWDLRDYAETVVRQKLTSIPGVSNLLIMWGSAKQYIINLDPQKVVSSKLSLSDIENSLINITNPGGAGVLLQKTTEFPVSLLPVLNTTQNLSHISLGKRENWSIILLSDVANITSGVNVQRRGDAIIDGKPGIIIRISKVPNANTINLTKDIESAISSLEKELPKDYQLHSWLFKQSWFIEKGLSNVEEALLDAAVIVGIVVFLFLMNIRTTTITLISLPVTLLMSAIVFHIFGLSINIMILGGITIAIGELVDDAIVDIENIYRRLRENLWKPEWKREKPLTIIFHASREVRWSVIYATLLQIIVFTPFLLLPGIDGKILAPIGIAYIVSMIMSLVTAITLVPVLSSWLLPSWMEKKRAKKESKWEEESYISEKLKKVALIPILWSLKNPKKAIIFALLSLPITGIMYLSTSKEWLPAFNESSYTIWITTKPWSSLEYTTEVVRDFSEQLKKIPNIVSTGAILGRADADAHAQWSNNAEIEVALNLNISNAEKDSTYQDINKLIEQYRDKAIISIGQPITHRVEEIVSGIRAPLVIKIFGNDLDILETYSKELLTIVQWVNGTLNPSLEPQTKVPAITISPLLTPLALHSMSYVDIKDILQVAIGWKEIAQVVEGTLSYPVILTYAKNWKWTPTNLASIPIISPLGQQISLWSLVAIETTKKRNVISHDNGERRAVISGYTQGRSIVDVVDDIRERVDQNPLPPWIRISYEGLYQAQKESAKLLTIIWLIVLWALSGVLYWHFGSIKIVGQILLDVATGWFWGMIGVWISGGVLSTAHMVGFISLMGIVARNGIMLIDHYKHLFREYGYIDEKMIIRGSLERVVPVAMTAISAILWLLPLVLGAWDAGKEMLSPIATVIFWWLAVSTAIELCIRPGIFFKYSKDWLFQKELETRREAL